MFLLGATVFVTFVSYASPYDWGGRGIEAEAKGRESGIAMHFFRPVESFWYCLVIAMQQVKNSSFVSVANMENVVLKSEIYLQSSLCCNIFY